MSATTSSSPVLGRVLFGTGASSVVLLALVVALSRAAPDLGALSLSIVGALFLVPHAGFTWLRAWRTVGGPALVVGSGVAAAVAATAVVAAGGLEQVWTLAACVLPCHVALQTYRTTRVLTRDRTRPPSRLLVVAAVLLAALGVLAVMAGPRAPLVLRGSLPPLLPVVAGLSLVPLGLVGVALRAAPRQLAWALPPFAIAAAMWSAPGLLDGTGVLDPVATAEGAFAAGHAIQLAWLALFAGARTATLENRTFDGIAFVGSALVLGALFLVDIPWLASRVAGVDLVTALLAVEAAVILQTALVDVRAFSLRDPLLARALLEDTAPAPHGRAEVSNARALAFAVPGLVVSLGLVVDVAQSWRLRAGSSPEEVASALALHPHDARGNLRIAAGAFREGDVEEARASLGRLDKAHAFSPAAERLRLELCTRHSDATTINRCADQLPEWLKGDPFALVLSSRMALRVGQPGRARSLAEDALRKAPGDVAALVALGLAEAAMDEQKGRLHLEQAIDAMTVRLGGGDPLVADASWLEVGLALADAWRRERAFENALDIADRLLKGLEGSEDLAGQLLAQGLRARILDDAGDAKAALASYQQALRAAPGAGLPAEEVMLWADYGALLGRSQAPVEHRYACALKATQAATRVPEAHPERKHVELVTTTMRVGLEEVMSEAATAAVRDDLDAAVEAALTAAF